MGEEQKRLLDLPVELLALIVEYIEPHYLFSCFQVCKDFTAACNSEPVWKNRCDAISVTFNGVSWKSSYHLGKYHMHPSPPLLQHVFRHYVGVGSFQKAPRHKY